MGPSKPESSNPRRNDDDGDIFDDLGGGGIGASLSTPPPTHPMQTTHHSGHQTTHSEIGVTFSDIIADDFGVFRDIDRGLFEEPVTEADPAATCRTSVVGVETDVAIPAGMLSCNFYVF